MTVSTLLDRLRPALPTIGWVLGIGTFMAILAPYQSGRLGWPTIWFYWTGLMAIGWISGTVFSRVLERLWPDLPDWAVSALNSFLVSIPITFGVISIEWLAGGQLPWLAAPIVYVMVWVISAAVSALSWMSERRTSADSSPPAENVPQVGEALVSKLPHRLRSSSILALASEDHYLRVYTEAGDALVLMRLSDALSAVDTLDGARTHRSWWVARQAVMQVSRGDGRAVLTLKNDIEVPVSRTYSPRLREAGWY